MAEEQKETNEVEMPQLALRCAEFFMKMAESCVDYYHRYKEEKLKKTKIIKKNNKKNKSRARPKESQNPDEDISKLMPKKPLTAYIIYFQQKKPKFVEKHPGLNLSELTKLIAKEWKEIDEEQRKPYLDQAHQQRKRYERQLLQFRNMYGMVKEIDQQNPQSDDNIEAFVEEEDKMSAQPDGSDRMDDEIPIEDGDLQKSSEQSPDK